MTVTPQMFRTVFEVGATIAASLDVDQTLPAVARKVGEALCVQYCDINMYDRASDTITYVAVWAEELTQDDLDYVGTVVCRDERPGRFVAVDSRELVEAYVDDETMDPDERRLMEQWSEFAAMEVPLVVEDEVIGLLGVVERAGMRRYADEEKELLRLLAAPVAAAIRNARLYSERRQRAERLAALLDAGRAMTRSVDLPDVLAEVARQAVMVGGCSQSAIYEFDAATDTIIYRALHEEFAAPDAEPDDDLDTSYVLGDYQGERAILMSGDLVVEHRSDADLPRDRRESMESWGEVTCLSVPLWFEREPLGILRVYDMEKEREFTEGQRELFRGLGQLAAAAIHTARLFGAQQEQSRRLLRVFETSRDLVAASESADVLHVVEDGAASLLNGDGATARVWLSTSDEPQDGEAAGSGLGDSLARESLTDLQPRQAAAGDASELAVPLAAKGQTEGVLRLSVPRRRVFTEAELEAAQVLANQAAVALENVRLYHAVQEQAIHDGLTGLYNHRHFHERLPEECTRAARYELPLSLLMIDIDDFKRFNDEFGHQMGDEVLREVGEILAASVRDGVDLPARYGGEEFAVILPHTAVAGAETLGRRLRGRLGGEGASQGAAGTPAEGDSVPAGGDVVPSGGDAVPSGGDAVPPEGDGAVVVGERLRHDIAERSFAGHGGRRYAHVTVSVGVATTGEGRRRPQDLLTAADKALYVAKRRGKDRVEVFTA